MPEPEKRDREADVIAATSETVVLAIKLVADEVVNLPQRVAAALSSPPVRQALELALREIGRDSLKAVPVAVARDQARGFARQIAAAALTDAIGQIKASQDYKALDANARRITETLKATPLGVYFDKHDKLILIVAAGVVVGGAVAAYVVRSGDAVAQPAMWLLRGRPVKFKMLGNLEAGLECVKFVPSSRTVEMKVFGSGTWDLVKANVNVAIRTVDADAAVTASGDVLVAISPRVAGRVEASADPQKGIYRLGLGIKQETGEFSVFANSTEGRFGVGASASYAPRASGLDFSLMGSHNDSEKCLVVGSLGWRF